MEELDVSSDEFGGFFVLLAISVVCLLPKSKATDLESTAAAAEAEAVAAAPESARKVEMNLSRKRVVLA